MTATTPATSTTTGYDVELRSITKRYGSVLALDGLSLDVRTGEFMTLLGPSGGGKSTTLRMIGGFLSPDRGEILLRGRPIADVPAHDRETATVFQSYALFPHLSIGDNIGYGLQQQGVPKSAIRDRVREALALVALPGTEHRRPHELSAGQQQRVALARALAVLPAVLLLDEPLGALDVSLRRQMQEELRAIQQRTGITFVYVTHDQEEALSMSDRLAVIREGRVAQVGTPETLYERPLDAFVARFMGACNILTGPVVSMDDDGATVRLAGEPVRVSGAKGDVATVMIRPERLRLIPDALAPNDTDVSWAATVTAFRYQGATTAVRLATAEGAELVASVGPDDLTGILPGAVVRVSTQSRHIVPLTA